jgi:nucleotide-binding universal stress UspA family protein
VTIVVGVSPITGSPQALRWAAEEARLRNVSVRAVLAWRMPSPAAAPAGRPPGGTGEANDGNYLAAAELALREHVRTALGDAGNVQCVVTRGNAVNGLLSHAEDADLIVIGETEESRMSNVRAGLATPRLLGRAKCPVVVIPSAYR